MIKRVDVAVYNSMIQARQGTWKAGVSVLGLKEQGVGWSVDEHNRALVSPDMEKRINEARGGDHRGPHPGHGRHGTALDVMG